MDLSQMSTADLKTLRKQVEREMQSREQKEKQEAIRKIQQIADEAGISLADVTGGRRRRKSGPAKVQYRDPDNPSNTWAGRGRKPKWLEEKLRSGKKLDAFAV